MSLELPTQIKAALEPIPELGGRIGLDDKAEDELYPNVTMVPDVNVLPGLVGDSVTLAHSRTCQVDLWQEREDEDDDLMWAVHNAVDGLKLTGTGLRLKVTQWARLVDPDYGVIHHAFTLVATTLTGS